MALLWEGLVQAVRLLLAADPEVLGITLRSLQVSGTATLVALVLGWRWRSCAFRGGGWWWRW